MKKFLLFFCIIFYANFANAASTDFHENQSKGAKVRLLASFYKDKDDHKKLIAALHFKISSGWKIYGYGSDIAGIGLPPSVDFKGSTNYSKHEIYWSKPFEGEEKIGDQTLKYLYYKDEIILPIEIDLKEIDKNTKLEIALNYGLCKDICVPANEKFSLEVPSEIDEKTLLEIQKFYPNQLTKNIPQEKVDAPQAPDSLGFKTFTYFILLAILGGAILNIMPCVLPILSIKLLSVVNHLDAKISRIRFAFFSTTIGILFCFIILACLASAIKLTSNALGWGLQFQNPYFLIFLILILILMIGNLSGIFQITFDQFLTNILNKKIDRSEAKKNIFTPNFLSGILAVLLATPCSAPFLGSAISFALTQNIATIFIIFFAIGIGFASPYIILFIAPKLVYLLPKPGVWMEKIKRLMILFLAAAAIWLLYVLYHNVGAPTTAAVCAVSILTLLALKIKSRFIKFLTLATLISGLFSLPSNLQNSGQAAPNKNSQHDKIWRNFNENEIQKLVLEGKTVVVDVTADWCLTCKFNKIRVLQDSEIIQKLTSENIIAMRADITKPDQKILDYLHKNQRFAIPFNAVYGPRASQGVLTKELLTKKELLELINKASLATN